MTEPAHPSDNAPSQQPEALFTLAPYYQDDSVTLYHGVDCGTWLSLARNGRHATAHAHAVRKSPNYPRVSPLDIGRPPSTLPSAPGRERTTMGGKATAFRKRAAGRGLSVYTEISALVHPAALTPQNGITETATRRTTSPATSPSCAGSATWLRTGV